MKVRSRCGDALQEAFDFAKQAEARPACGGRAGFDRGYNLSVSEHDDGSGVRINLSGCYLATNIADAIAEEVKKQIWCIEARLRELGVDGVDSLTQAIFQEQASEDL